MLTSMMLQTCLAHALLLSLSAPVSGQQDFRPIPLGDPPELGSVPIFPGARYDEDIPRPEAFLGQPVGSRAAHHGEVFTYFHELAKSSPRVSYHEIGRTYESRELGYAIVTTPANHARIDEIKADIAKLHDPRGIRAPELDAIIDRTPAIAWMAYSIHGDETSGSDGALAFAHHLAASQDAKITALLEDVVVVIDPMMNPDGRERMLALIEQNAGYTPAWNARGMQRGRWPYGRGNHYLFDMNRDWMPGACPETRARWAALADFRPQLFVDAHEMGSLDTFLFSPPREPIQQHSLIADTEWPATFSRDQAAAFDERGWSYYTREWFEGWGPFYTDSWAQLAGAVGILYEQARFAGQSIQRRSGERVTYREAVAHQAVSSLANVRTLAQNRAAVLMSFRQIARANLQAETRGNDRMFVLVPGRNEAREDRLVRTLTAQGIECLRAEGGFTGRASVSTLDATPRDRQFAAGAIVVSPRQPMGSRMKAFLELDPRFSPEVLADERRRLEHENESGVYDVTAWSLPLAFDVDAYWCAHADVAGELVDALASGPSGLVATESGAPVYGWAVDGASDAAVAFAVRALESGLAVRLSDEPFESGGRPFARGSLLIRRHENPDVDAEALVEAAAAAAGVAAHALTSGRARGDGPDLGGGHFELLERPRVGLVGNAPIRADTYGHLWHLLDVELGQRVTLVDAQALGRTDLRQFNVLVLPPGATRATLAPIEDDLEAWVRSGGTLIAVADSAAALCDPDGGLSSVRLLRDVLDERDRYRWAAWREREALSPTVDPERVYDGPRAAEEPATTAPTEPAADERSVDGPVAPEPEQRDRWLRRFAPQGAFVRGFVDPAAWITVGAGDELPVFFRGDRAFQSMDPVRTPVRLAPIERLRLSGLVWPEAAERIAESAFLTVERLGHGQVVLFATTPGFRGLYRGTGRLFANAVVYGPGVGANPPLGW